MLTLPHAVLRSALFAAPLFAGIAACSLEAGVDVDLRLQTTASVPAITQSIRAKVVDVVTRRLHAGGFDSASVAASGSDGLVVSHVRRDDVSAVVRLVRDEGRLVFAVLSDDDAARAATDAHFGDDPGPHGALARSRCTGLTGDDIASAKADVDAQGSPVILFQTRRPERFRRVTSADLGKPIGIFIDGRFLSAPVIEGPIGASGEISGRFTTAEAHEIASVLDGGALPVPITSAPPNP